jgi:heme-degrading monooxygenase HmoA
MASSEAATTTISTEANLATLINIFTVEPERQQELVDVLVEATDRVMRALPGFVSANIHASHDGTRVVNYAQWATPEDFHAMLENPAAGEHMTRAAGLASHYEPRLYDVRSVHHR